MVKALYAFSGDPITYGHIDLIERAAVLFDELVVGIGHNPSKKYLFTVDERLDMARKVLDYIPNVSFTSFDGLTVTYAFKHNIPAMIKGIRNGEDEEYERKLQMGGKTQQFNIETVFLYAHPEKGDISSSLVKEIQKHQGDIHNLVPMYVKQCLEAKISNQYIVGITGEIGTGKTYVSEKLIEIGKKRGIAVHNIELDDIGHKILEEWTEERYVMTREEIAKAFGSSVKNIDGTINRKALGEIVFNDSEKMKILNAIMEKPLKAGMEDVLKGKTGLILYNAALIAESDLSYICNNNVVLINADKSSQERRMKKRGLTPDQINNRLQSQYTSDEKRQKILHDIKNEGNGKLWEYDNSDGKDEKNIELLFDEVVKELKVK